MLSKTQQNIIENSIWVVNTALKNQGLALSPKTEDLRQSAILYMCKVIQRFDPSRNIKWETFAYKNVYLYIKRKHIKEIRRAKWEIDDETAYNLQHEELPLEEPKMFDEAKYMVEHIMKECSPKERQYLDLKLQGYKREEIGEIMGVSSGFIRKCHENIIEKARERCL